MRLETKTLVSRITSLIIILIQFLINRLCTCDMYVYIELSVSLSHVYLFLHVYVSL